MASERQEETERERKKGNIIALYLNERSRDLPDFVSFRPFCSLGKTFRVKLTTEGTHKRLSIRSAAFISFLCANFHSVRGPNKIVSVSARV